MPPIYSRLDIDKLLLELPVAEKVKLLTGTVSAFTYRPILVEDDVSPRDGGTPPPCQRKEFLPSG